MLATNPDPQSDPGDLIRRAASGDKAALDALIKAFYPELRKIAESLMKKEDLGHTLQPTAVVHEAYLRMLGDRSIRASERGLFMWLAVRAMRYFLKDYWKHKNTLKGGRGWKKVPFEVTEKIEGLSRGEFVELSDAIDELERLSPEQAKIVEMHALAGWSLPDIAKDLGKSLRTIEGRWQAARLKLKLLLVGP